MDQQTRQQLRQNQFLTTTGDGISLASATRKSVFITVGALLAAIIVAVIAVVIYNHRSDEAADAFGNAMQVYQAPVASGATPPEPGVKTYASAAERARVANPLFLSVADQYGLTRSGRNARYMAGVTYMDEGQNQSAEDTLKKVAGSWDRDLADLAKFTLAGLYRQTGRDADAVGLYQQLTDKPASTVPAGSAQIALAELYAAQGKTEQARKIYAKLKDQDVGADKANPGIVSTIAAQKLNPTASPAAPPQ